MGDIQMQTGVEEWAESSREERLAHCLARSLLAQSRANYAEGSFKYAYLEVAAIWLTLADIVQWETTIA
jgi:hypothetical protein